MDLKLLSNDLQNRFLGQPQKQKLIQIAIDSIQAGIQELARLGLRYELITEDRTVVPVEYPKMLYRAEGEGLVTILVNNEQEDLDAVNNGYVTQAETKEPTPAAPELPPSEDPLVSQDAPPELKTGGAQGGAPQLLPSDRNVTLDTPVKSPAPAMTDKQVVEQRMATGSGASTPNTKPGGQNA